RDAQALSLHDALPISPPMTDTTETRPVSANRGPTDDGPLADIGEALEAFARGEILVVVDDEDRENEGDLIMAAEHVTPEKIAFLDRKSTRLNSSHVKS